MIQRLAAMMAFSLLGLSMTMSAETQAGAYEAARADMSTKARTCKAAGAKVAGAMDCFRTCAKNARTLQNASGVDAETVAGLRAACDAKFALAQQGQAAPVPATPDYAGRAAALPQIAAYCREAVSRMGCPVDPSEPNWLEREQMCNIAAPCGRSCGDDGLVARLKANPVSRDVRTLDRCEENHGTLKAWLDG